MNKQSNLIIFLSVFEWIKNLNINKSRLSLSINSIQIQIDCTRIMLWIWIHDFGFCRQLDSDWLNLHFEWTEKVKLSLQTHFGLTTNLLLFLKKKQKKTDFEFKIWRTILTLNTGIVLQKNTTQVLSFFLFPSQTYTTNLGMINTYIWGGNYIFIITLASHLEKTNQ